MKHRFSTFLLLGLIPFAFFLVFAYRWIFFYHFSPSYFQDWFTHSQWAVPASPRIMGDSGLYQWSGYLLVKGDDPFHVNPEVPPLVKYLYGISIAWFSNPYYMAAGMYVLSVGLFWLLARELFVKKRTQILAMFLFATSPVFFSQIGEIGLDLPQLCFLLLHLIFFFQLWKTKKNANAICYAMLAGLALGGFTAAKVGIFSPFIFVLDAWFLYREKKLKFAMLILLGLIGAYIGTYFQYFGLHHSIIDWLKSQKWIIAFYAQSGIKAIPFMVLITLISSVFLHWWNGWSLVREWTILWPISLVIFIQKSFREKIWQFWHTSKQTPMSYILFLTAGLIAANSIIPFWPRYLIVIFPFLLILMVEFLEKHAHWQKWIVVLVVVHLVFYVFTQPNEILDVGSQAWDAGSYQELYNFTDLQNQHTISRDDFTRQLQTVDHQLNITQKKIVLTPHWVFPWQNSDQIDEDVTYSTEIGDYHFHQKITAIREQNQWHIVWKWTNVLPNYQPTDTLSVTVKPSATAKPQPFVSVTPNQTTSIEEVVVLLSRITSLNDQIIRNRLLVLNPADFQVPIDFIKADADPNLVKQAAKEKGIQIQPKLTGGQSTGSISLQKPNSQPEVIFHTD